MKNKYIILTALCALLLCACEKEIEFKGEVKKPVLVLNGFLTPDENVAVHLSKSHFVMDDQAPHAAVTDAEVELYVNGTLRGKLQHRKPSAEADYWKPSHEAGWYESAYRPQVGDKIEIRASAVGFEVVRAQTQIPAAPVFELADSTLVHTITDVTTQYISRPGYSIKLFSHTNKFRLRLKENKDETNFYFARGMHNIYRYREEDGTLYLWNTEKQWIQLSKSLKGGISDSGSPLEDVLWGEEGDSESKRQTENLFSDEFVNGRELFFEFEYSENLKAVMTRPNGSTEIINASDAWIKEYAVGMSNMTPDYYQYVVSAAKAYDSDENPFMEPVQVRTNVENGLGILGAYTTTWFTFRFEKYTDGAYSIKP